jgi:uncharacterized membrane protein YfcA
MSENNLEKISLRQSGYLTILGIVVGVFSSSLGSGGGSILIPALTLIMGYKIKEIVGASLAIIVLTAFFGFTFHLIFSPENVEFLFVGLMLMGSLIGAKLGADWTHSVRSWFLMYLSAFIMFFVGLNLFGVLPVFAYFSFLGSSIWLLMFLGLVSGILSSMLGIGAGVLIIPILNLVFALPMTLAVPTCLAVIAPTTLAGSVFHNNRGKLDWRMIRRLIPGSLVGALCGVFLNHFLSDEFLKITLGIYVIVSAFEMIITAKVEKKMGNWFFEPTHD